LKVAAKVFSEYESVKDMPTVQPGSETTTTDVMITDATEETKNNTTKIMGVHDFPSAPGVSLSEETAEHSEVTEGGMNKLLNTLTSANKPQVATGVLDIYRGGATAVNQLALRGPKLSEAIKPVWHAPWKLMRVIAGHGGWVRSIAVDKSNDWFATGAADNTVKIWDLATGTLKLTLPNHIGPVRGIAISDRHPYMFTVAEDKKVLCWDLEYNKVIRHYHGHLSGVYSISMHPTIDIIVTGGRDATARVWDIRTKSQIHCLAGHTGAVDSVLTQSTDPQVITGSHDSQIRTWDLAAGKVRTVLTNHKKAVRALVMHPSEYTFASASVDNVKKWKLPEAMFMSNLSGHKAIVNTLAVNKDGVLVSSADNGTMYFWDWKSGYNFQRMETQPQPGSLESEAGIFASIFDRTGSRLFTCEADKSIKVWREDDEATPESHPLNWKPTRTNKY
jgi:pleiotropic regulator 1